MLCASSLCYVIPSAVEMGFGVAFYHSSFSGLFLGFNLAVEMGFGVAARDIGGEAGQTP